MKFHSVIAAALLASVFGVSSSMAATKGFTDGKQFVANCSDLTSKSQHYEWCLGFITGFDQAHTTMSYVTKRHRDFRIQRDGVFYCPDNKVTYQSAINTIINYINANPKRMKLPAGLLAAYALHASYPCKKKAVNQDPSKSFQRD